MSDPLFSLPTYRSDPQLSRRAAQSYAHEQAARSAATTARPSRPRRRWFRLVPVRV